MMNFELPFINQNESEIIIIRLCKIKSHTKIIIGTVVKNHDNTHLFHNDKI
jgi:hypothetical protein